MRELKGNEDLQLAKDVLITFENEHYKDQQAASDIQEGLYWDGRCRCYSADLGTILRGEYDNVRIFEFDKEDDWLTPLTEGYTGWNLTAFVKYDKKTYFFLC